jgi:hypothetical protein
MLNVYNCTYWQLTYYCWQTVTKDRPTLSSERAPPQRQNRNCQTVTNIWSWGPDGARHQDRQTDWPSVAMWLRLGLRLRLIGGMRPRTFETVLKKRTRVSQILHQSWLDTVIWTTCVLDIVFLRTTLYMMCSRQLPFGELVLVKYSAQPRLCAVLCFKINNVRQLTTNRRAPKGQTHVESLHPFLVTFVRNVKSKKIFKLNGLKHINIKVELYKTQIKLTQCYNSQKFGHIGAKCKQYLPCLWCWGGHLQW